MMKNMTIKIKIISLIIVSLSFLTLILTIFSVDQVKDSLLKKNYSILTSVRDSKSNQIKNFFAERIGDINVLSKSSNAKEIIYDLDNAFRLLILIRMVIFLLMKWL